jgi:hypothetical protein
MQRDSILIGLLPWTATQSIFEAGLGELWDAACGAVLGTTFCAVDAAPLTPVALTNSNAENAISRQGVSFIAVSPVTSIANTQIGNKLP